MSRPLALALIFWNIVLSVLVGYALTRGKSPTQIEERSAEPALAEEPDTVIASSTRDSIALKDARIAFFNMDSIQENYTLVKESADRVRAEGKRLEGDLAREMQKAQGRYQELMQKDHTYSTQAQLQADQKELEDLQTRIQDMRMSSQDRIDELQIKMLSDISMEIEGYLEEYNKSAGFDYIFSIQSGGQIWVGNKGLDITGDILNGLNARHSAKKAGK